MSSLTDEQKKRIEENRAKALAKLAQKKSIAQHQHQNNTNATKCSGNLTLKANTFYNKSHTFSSGTTKKPDILNLRQFEYRHNTSETSPHKATTKAPFNKTTQDTQSTSSNSGNVTKGWNATKSDSVTNYKSGNDALMKARTVNGTCVLMNKTRFKVVVGFNAKLIGVLKSIPSKCYGRYQLPIMRKQCIICCETNSYCSYYFATLPQVA